MDWEHSAIIRQGTVNVLQIQDGTTIPCSYSLKEISTGKSRMFWGIGLMLTIEGKETEARAKGNLESFSPVLKAAGRQLAENGQILMVAGNAEGYYETGMSGSSGYGYVDQLQREAFHILDPLPSATPWATPL